MEENHDEQDRDSEVEESPLSNNEEEEVNSDGDSMMEVPAYGNDNEGENSTYNTNGTSVLAAAAAELMRRQIAMRTGNLNFAEGHEQEHEDILAKLKLQVRELKVHNSQLGELATTAANMTSNNLQDHMNSFKARAPTTPFLFAPNRGVAIPEDGNFQFTSPMQFPAQLHHFMPQAGPPPATSSGSNPPSTSPQSSEGSGGSNQNNWSFEEQFKQLYELTDDPPRKVMLDELFSFNQRRGKHNRTPINRLPIMAKTVLDLYELFNLVVARGGLVEVINKKLWQEIIKGLRLPSSITSAAFTLRTQYMKFLFAFECEKYNLSTNEELQAAIDGNRREGRRSSYGAHYENMRPSGRSPNPVQMAQLAAVTRHQQAQEQQLLSRLSSQFMANGHHPVMHPPGLSQLNGATIPGMAMPGLNINFEQYAAAARMLAERGGSPSMQPTAAQGDLNRSPSPNNHNALTTFNNNLVLFNSFLNNNNTVKPVAPQEEALNLSEAAQTATPVKRERVDKDDEPTSLKKKSRESSKDDTSLAGVPQPSNNHHSSPRTNIVINNREGDPVNGMVVSMEVNGVAYQGVLFPVPDDKVQTSNKKNGS